MTADDSDGLHGLDVAIIPTSRRYTMDSRDAVKAVAKLRPKTVIPGHFDTFPTIADDPHADITRAECSRTTN